jgi:hypothetical protein
VCVAGDVGATPTSSETRGDSWLLRIAGSTRKLGCPPDNGCRSSVMSSKEAKEVDEHRLLVALDAARDEVAALGRERGPVVTAVSAARARGSVQTSHDASESARMDDVIIRNDRHAAAGRLKSEVQLPARQALQAM